MAVIAPLPNPALAISVSRKFADGIVFSIGTMANGPRFSRVTVLMIPTSIIVHVSVSGSLAGGLQFPIFISPPNRI